LHLMEQCISARKDGMESRQQFLNSAIQNDFIFNLINFISPVSLGALPGNAIFALIKL